MQEVSGGSLRCAGVQEVAGGSLRCAGVHEVAGGRVRKISQAFNHCLMESFVWEHKI